MMEKPIINEVFADNGEHSHWELIDCNTGVLLWSEDIEESNAQRAGNKTIISYYTPNIQPSNDYLNPVKFTTGFKKPIMHIENYIPDIKDINYIVSTLPNYIVYNPDTNILFNKNTNLQEGVEGDKVTYTIYKNCEFLSYTGTVKGYTNSQIVETYEYGTEILSAGSGVQKIIIKNDKKND